MKQAMPAGRQGFTLIELIVVLGIFGVMTVAGSNFLIQTIRNANRATVENEVRQAANKIMQDLSLAIRSAKCADFAQDPTGNVTFTTYDDDCVSAVAHTYQFTFDPASLTATGKVLKDGVQISPDSVAILDCGLECGVPSACLNGAQFRQTGAKSIEIELSARTPMASQRQDFCAQLTLRDTVTPRMQ